ncbi:DUF3307 domain-containing protein [Streptomyces sp. MJM8645]|uniref:DUF3307 domain-containing protein n=1 Tax=Streptomycetaceae TaxID=2062 RepID=UPI0009A0654A|nr:DUF3307 domain-containing protein [Streptomyces sp. MJM8645]
MFPSIFIVLLTCHWAADFPGQTDHQASHKADRTLQGWVANLTHAFTHVAITAVVLWLVGLAEPDLHPTLTAEAFGLAWVGISHSAIDRRRMVK